MDFIKEEIGYLTKSDNSDDYYFEGVASSYGNADCYGDIFMDGSLDENVGKTVPIMPNHSWDIFKAIGSGVLEKDGKKILIKGDFIKDDEMSEKVVKLKKSGVPLKLSIGGKIVESKTIQKEGKSYRGITKAEIVEVSVVFRGANPKAEITKSDELSEQEEVRLLKAVDKLNNIWR